MKSEASNPSTQRREREKEARRAEIIRASVDIFARDGFFGAKLDDIADASGFSRSGLYLYFPDGKEELFAQALHLAVIARDNVVREVLEHNQKNALAGEVWHAFARLYHETPEYVKLLIALGFEDIRVTIAPQHLRPVIRQGTQTFHDLDEALRRVRGNNLPELHLGWTLWSFFLGVVQFMESLAHMGREPETASLLESAFVVLEPSFRR